MLSRENHERLLVPDGIDPERIALGIRQPWVELILREVKTLEVRSQPVALRGRIYLYSARRCSDHPAAALAIATFGLSRAGFVMGQLVGAANLIACRPARPEDSAAACVPAESLIGQYVWSLADVERFTVPVPVRFAPYGVWFYPFQRKGEQPVSGA